MSSGLYRSSEGFRKNRSCSAPMLLALRLMPCRSVRAANSRPASRASSSVIRSKFTISPRTVGFPTMRKACRPGRSTRWVLPDHVAVCFFKTLNNVSGLTSPSGEIPVKLLGIDSNPPETQRSVFCIRDRADVRWMRDHGIDGATGDWQRGGVSMDYTYIRP